MSSPRPNRRSGLALAVVLLTLLLITVLGLALGFLGSSNLNQIRQTSRTLSLVHGADGGLHELMDVLYGNEGYGLAGNETASGVYSSAWGMTTYRWTFVPSATTPYCTNNLNGETAATGYGGRTVPPGTALLYVQAEAPSPGGGSQAVAVGATTTNRYAYAIASDGVIDLGNVSSLIPGQGHVRSNLVGGSPNINADVVDGMTFSRDGTGSIQVDPGSGPERYNEPPLGLPDIPINDIIASWSAAGVGGSHPYGGPADFQYSSSVTADTDASGNLEIGGTRITPPATLYVNGDFQINGNADLAKGIHIFCTGSFTVNGALDQVSMAGGAVAATAPAPAAPARSSGPTPSAPGGEKGSPTPDPSPSPSPSGIRPSSPVPGAAGPTVSPNTNFILSGDTIRFNGGSSQSINLIAMNGIRQNGSSDMRGFFYVRNGDFDVNGKSGLTGVIITRSGAVQGDILASGTNVVYDPAVLGALAGISMDLSGAMRASAWWIQQ